MITPIYIAPANAVVNFTGFPELLQLHRRRAWRRKSQSLQKIEKQPPKLDPFQRNAEENRHSGGSFISPDPETPCTSWSPAQLIDTNVPGILYHSPSVNPTNLEHAQYSQYCNPCTVDCWITYSWIRWTQSLKKCAACQILKRGPWIHWRQILYFPSDFSLRRYITINDDSDFAFQTNVSFRRRMPTFKNICYQKC